MSLSDVLGEARAYDAEAEREVLNHPCDVCHEAEGVAFTDTYWACGGCAAEIVARLNWEAYGAPGAEDRKPPARERNGWRRTLAKALAWVFAAQAWFDFLLDYMEDLL